MADYDPYTTALFQIESGGNPNAVTGSNRGLGQFSPDLEKRYGINPANRGDPEAQASAVAQEREEHRPTLERVLGQPTDADYYFAHQQGLAGAQAHIANPDSPAWQSIRRFYPSDRVAQSAIMGNLPASMKNGRDVNDITSGEFRQWWNDRFNRAQGGGGPMTAALSGGDVTGSVPQGRRQMPSPMDEASSPGILDRVINGVQTAQNNGVGDTLQNVGAWLMARDNPAGGAALLAGLKKDKNAGEWSHQIDPNTGQIVSVQNKTGQVRVLPIPGYNTNKAADEARLKDEAKADVDLDTKLGDEGRGLGARRESLNQAKDILGNLKGGLANADQIVKLKQLGNQMGITNFAGVPDAQVAATIANRLALEAQNQGGTRLLPGSMSDSDRKFISAMAANPTNDPEANKRILEIADKALQREEAASKIHQSMTGNGFTRKGFNAAVTNLDKQRAADEAAAQAAAPQQPTTAPPPLSSFKF